MSACEANSLLPWMEAVLKEGFVELRSAISYCYEKYVNEVES